MDHLWLLGECYGSFCSNYSNRTNPFENLKTFALPTILSTFRGSTKLNVSALTSDEARIHKVCVDFHSTSRQYTFNMAMTEQYYNFKNKYSARWLPCLIDLAQ